MATSAVLHLMNMMTVITLFVLELIVGSCNEHLQLSLPKTQKKKNTTNKNCCVVGAGTIGRPPQGRIVTETEDERRLSEYVFLSNSIPWWVAVGGYLCFVAIGTGTIPQLYPPAKW